MEIEPESDTFRFMDGPQFQDQTDRTMAMDGVPDPELEIWIAISSSDSEFLTSEALPEAFPSVDIADTPHTFSVDDAGGTLLLQLDSLE